MSGGLKKWAKRAKGKPLKVEVIAADIVSKEALEYISSKCWAVDLKGDGYTLQKGNAVLDISGRQSRLRIGAFDLNIDSEKYDQPLMECLTYHICEADRQIDLLRSAMGVGAEA